MVEAVHIQQVIDEMKYCRELIALCEKLLGYGVISLILYFRDFLNLGNSWTRLGKWLTSIN